MTLKTYSPEMLDQFALRLLDLAALMREMANRSREHNVDEVAVHEKKAQEWCVNLERWARRAHAELEMKIIEARAARRALSEAERAELGG